MKQALSAFEFMFRTLRPTPLKKAWIYLPPGTAKKIKVLVPWLAARLGERKLNSNLKNNRIKLALLTLRELPV